MLPLWHSSSSSIGSDDLRWFPCLLQAGACYRCVVVVMASDALMVWYLGVGWILVIVIEAIVDEASHILRLQTHIGRDNYTCCMPRQKLLHWSFNSTAFSILIKKEHLHLIQVYSLQKWHWALLNWKLEFCEIIHVKACWASLLLEVYLIAWY